MHLNLQITTSEEYFNETDRQIDWDGDDISIPLIQRKCKVGYNSAYRTFENLVEDGLIERGKKFCVSKFV